jgi:hypothetical protein
MCGGRVREVEIALNEGQNRFAVGAQSRCPYSIKWFSRIGNDRVDPPEKKKVQT